jgi:hypothetical protein
MPTSNLLQALLEIPILVDEVEALQANVKAGVTTTTPGIGASIEGIPGKISLTFTPAAIATVPTTTH